MNLKLFIGLFALLVLVSAATIQVQAQSNVATIPIRISDDGAVGDSVVLYMVSSPNGSYGLDSLNTLYQEVEYPPAGFGFDARWLSFAVYANGGYGGGFIPMDIRGIPSNPTKKDTFKISCGNGDNGAENFLLQWPTASYLAARCDSMFLQDKSGNLVDSLGNPIGKINMFNQRSLFLPQALIAVSNSSFPLFIYKYGVHLVDTLAGTYPPDSIATSVRELSHLIPSSFALRQNYPNPFNPTTTIRFDIQKQSVTDIAVYNLLGQKVATLISQSMMPGTYSAVWNGLSSKGLNAGSGVYFIRMTARPTDGKGEVFSSLQKVVLMK